jgi:predicted hotdog family 3-hydroxylacyl-ACP dehydratase
LKFVAPLLREDIARLIPHQGPMCLLARVDAWDAKSITCRADNHRSAGHPLRTRSGLLSTCLVEYAAQAMALHGALQATAPGGPRDGVLAAARDLRFALVNLDDLPEASPDELHIEASCDAADHGRLMYRFAARHAGTLLARGRVTVVLRAPQPAR